MSKRHDVPADSLLEPLSPFAERLARDAANRMAELPLLAGVEVEPWPDVATHEVVGRELARRRPFMDIEKKGTIGHRDTIIWLGVVAVASANRDDPVCLVTNDGGFLKDRDLHADLIDDLRDAGLKPERVAVYRDLFGVLTMLDKVKAAQEARDAHEAREAQAAQEANEAKEAREAQERAARVRIAVRQALHEYNGELVSLQWGREFDERDGGYSDPEIDAGLPSALEDVRVSFVESTFDILLDPPAPKSGMPATCEYDVEIGFDGVMDKYEWFSESYGDVELWGSDLDDHYVQVHAERTVRITVQVIYDDETDTAEVVQLVGGTWTG